MKKLVEKNNRLGFELRTEDFAIAYGDQLAYAMSLFASNPLTIYTSFFDQIFLRPNYDIALPDSGFVEKDENMKRNHCDEIYLHIQSTF